MKRLISLILILPFFMLTGCDTSNVAWENVKTAGRYIQKGLDSLWGKDYESYQVQSDEEFVGPNDEDFIPLSDSDLKNQFVASDRAIPQPKYSPGDTQSGIPNLQNFKTPANLANILKNISFETDDHVVRDKEDLMIVSKIATYLKIHPKSYLCIEGHCDNRASAAYNMALGTRRANHIRVLLIKQGVDFNKIYTISHGKEKPIALGNNPQDWRINRRAQFKIFEK